MRTAALLLAACVSVGAVADPGPELRAVDQVRQRAGQGDAFAAYRLGLMYRNGNRSSAVPALAAHWLAVAASGQVPAAMFILSNMLAAGEGIAKDEVAARRWLLAAAELGYPEALQQLALEEPDAGRAAQLMREAAHALTHRAPER